jgi:ATP-dependent RNA helicase MSS116
MLHLGLRTLRRAVVPAFRRHNATEAPSPLFHISSADVTAKAVVDSNAALEPQSSPNQRPGNAIDEDDKNVPFDTLKDFVSHSTLTALTGKPFHLKNMSQVQAAVLGKLPALSEPYDAEKPSPIPRDLLVKAKTGTGKTLGFLIPAIEARHKLLEQIRLTSKQEKGELGGLQTSRIFAKNNVGTLVISPTRELATQIANEAVKLATHHKEMNVCLFVGGISKRAQMREWIRGRRDIVVATPGRLRDLLSSEPDVAEAFKKTQTVSAHLHP